MDLSSADSQQLDQKWESDVRKTINHMRNMLVINKSTQREHILRGIQTVGIVAAGLFSLTHSLTHSLTPHFNPVCTMLTA